MTRALAVCLSVGLLALAVVPSVPAASSGSAVVSLVNHARARHGLKPVRQSPSLSRSSRQYARWMLRSRYYGHLSRIRASSAFHRLGEVLFEQPASGRSAGSAVRAWLRSPPHRALLLDGRFRWMGVGKASGRLGGRRVTLWVGHLGSH